jgi:shikimate kinase
MRIYLVGFMGSGKTAVGKKLALRLNYNFADLDKKIESIYKLSIPDIFSKYDEHTFRQLEHEVLKQTLELSNTVIATGGGTPCFYNNMELILQNGISVYLKLHPHSLALRLLKSHQKRPLILNKKPEDLEQFITDKLSEREPFYNRSDIIVKGENLEVSSIVELIGNRIRE